RWVTPLLPHTRCYRLVLLFLSPFVCRSCGWTDTLFVKFWFVFWLERLGNVCGCEGLAFHSILYCVLQIFQVKLSLGGLKVKQVCLQVQSVKENCHTYHFLDVQCISL